MNNLSCEEFFFPLSRADLDFKLLQDICQTRHHKIFYHLQRVRSRWSHEHEFGCRVGAAISVVRVTTKALLKVLVKSHNHIFTRSSLSFRPRGPQNHNWFIYSHHYSGWKLFLHIMAALCLSFVSQFCLVVFQSHFKNTTDIYILLN